MHNVFEERERVDGTQVVNNNEPITLRKPLQHTKRKRGKQKINNGMLITDNYYRMQHFLTGELFVGIIIVLLFC